MYRKKLPIWSSSSFRMTRVQLSRRRFLSARVSALIRSIWWMQSKKAPRLVWLSRCMMRSWLGRTSGSLSLPMCKKPWRQSHGRFMAIRKKNWRWLALPVPRARRPQSTLRGIFWRMSLTIRWRSCHRLPSVWMVKTLSNRTWLRLSHWICTGWCVKPLITVWSIWWWRFPVRPTRSRALMDCILTSVSSWIFRVIISVLLSIQALMTIFGARASW